MIKFIQISVQMVCECLTNDTKACVWCRDDVGVTKNSQSQETDMVCTWFQSVSTQGMAIILYEEKEKGKHNVWSLVIDVRSKGKGKGSIMWVDGGYIHVVKVLVR